MLMGNEDEKLAFARRFNHALDAAGVPPKGKNRMKLVAEMFGVTPKAAQKWTAGDAVPETARGMEIAEKLQISFEWLMTGRGAEKPPKSLSRDALLLAQIYDLVDKTAKAEIMGYTSYIMSQYANNARRAKTPALEALVQKILNR